MKNWLCISYMIVCLFSSAYSQCTGKSDCKGSRICVDGRCVDPPSVSMPAAHAEPAPAEAPSTVPLPAAIKRVDSAMTVAPAPVTPTAAAPSPISAVDSARQSEQTLQAGMGDTSSRADASVDTVPMSGLKAATVSVLPIESKALDPSLCALLTDEFRKNLAETGAFKVMERELMEKILREQAFQMTGAVDEKTAVEVGRIIGVSQMVAVSIAKTGENTFAVSAKLVDIATGSIISTASEKRSCDSFGINNRMLKNIAYALAGIQTEDHKEYLRVQQQELAEAQRTEKVKAKRFHVSFWGVGGYPIHVLMGDNEKPKISYYNAHAEFTEKGLPKDQFDFNGQIGGGYRVANRVWLELTCGYQALSTRESYVRSTYSQTYSLISGIDTLVYDENIDFAYKSWDNIAILNGGLGIRFVLYQSNRLMWGITGMPEIGYVSYKKSTIDSSYENSDVFINRVYTGKFQQRIEDIGTASLHGTCLGFDLSTGVNFFITPRVCLSADAGINLAQSLSLDGNKNGSVRTYLRNPTDASDSLLPDSSYSVPMSAIKGNFLGTGDYIMIANPDEKQTDPETGDVVPFKKSGMEFSSFRIRIGVEVYF